MATPFSIDQKLGVDLNTIVLAADIASGADSAQNNLGTVVTGSNGRTYVYAQAGGAIPAATAVCTVNATTFIATATGGAYLSPAVAMATGDQGWFSKPLV